MPLGATLAVHMPWNALTQAERMVCPMEPSPIGCPSLTQGHCAARDCEWIQAKHMNSLPTIVLANCYSVLLYKLWNDFQILTKSCIYCQ